MTLLCSVIVAPDRCSFYEGDQQEVKGLRSRRERPTRASTVELDVGRVHPWVGLSWVGSSF